MKGILGKKVGMTQIYGDDGQLVPVTVIQAGPCFVTQIKTQESDGYDAVQIGYDDVPPRKLTRPQIGHLRKADAPNLRFLREFQLDNSESLELGQRIDVSTFSRGDYVDVTGTSKGKGFAGVIKRHGFSRQRKTHGQSDRERAPGSLGAGTTPGRTFKGKRMGGKMGHKKVTTQNLQVMLVDVERNMMAIKGAIPGAAGGMVVIRAAHKHTIRSRGKA